MTVKPREAGRLTFVGKDVNDVWILMFRSMHGSLESAKSFVIVLEEGSAADRAFRDEIAALFRVRWIHDAKGKECSALRCFAEDEEKIEGFEVDGKRWTLTSFNRRFISHSVDRLEQRRNILMSDVVKAERQLEACRAKLAGLDAAFVDWEAT